eukprot:CAMPEP_0116861028 /NCGR_PEP_ID=MMETSP0418-20121206/22788_1 /TAXON_ID=1158023 /ORGANISM="Astrosyne radiata, Strain 13vi08-1A" /LENGTH=51 /DNA_ID=CAMNT_0004495591 /DNA_START=14 /DNA_END=166 /DNA_ORIENTATION=-
MDSDVVRSVATMVRERNRARINGHLTTTLRIQGTSCETTALTSYTMVEVHG